MSLKPVSKKRTFQQNEKRLGELHYRIIIGLLVAFVFYYWLVMDTTIGHDIRYTIYIFWLPELTGIAALYWYRRKAIHTTLSKTKGWFYKTVGVFFYLLQGIIFSYLSFGFAAEATFNYINKNTAELHPKETVRCKITRFWRGRNSSVDFEFQDRSESFKVNRATISDYVNEPPADYELEITMHKGIWNHYVVEDWEIVKVK